MSVQMPTQYMPTIPDRLSQMYMAQVATVASFGRNVYGAQFGSWQQAVSPTSSGRVFSPRSEQPGQLRVDTALFDQEGGRMEREEGHDFCDEDFQTPGSATLRKMKALGVPMDRFIASHQLAEDPVAVENPYDFLLLPCARNARPGMKTVDGSQPHLVEPVPLNRIPCRYGKDCFRKNCRFFHDKDDGMTGSTASPANSSLASSPCTSTPGSPRLLASPSERSPARSPNGTPRDKTTTRSRKPQGQGQHRPSSRGIVSLPSPIASC